jgi:hypothetical protein
MAVMPSMGFGVPAAASACLRAPEQPVVCFVGEGGPPMTGNEVALERKLRQNPLVARGRGAGGARHNVRTHRTALKLPVRPAWASAGKAPEHQRGVGAAETEGVRQDHFDRARLRPVRHQIDRGLD